ncbi:MAG: class F sortase [Candidatus Paceibacterota bacterium]|jgi:LPXTG-site transpeptidase (sortase) family protein
MNLSKNLLIQILIVILTTSTLLFVTFFPVVLKSPTESNLASSETKIITIYEQEVIVPVEKASPSVPRLSLQKTDPLIQINPSSSTSAKVGNPERIIIPTIGVDATIEHVGLTSGGEMDVPKGPENAAWFNLGPRPGEKGSSVIDGHSGWKNNIPAVFDSLYKLKKGDKVYIKNDMGVTTTFVVREFRTFNPKADASSVFGSNDGLAHLNLITCEGIWNNITKSSSERLVVFTDKVI